MEFTNLRTTGWRGRPLRTTLMILTWLMLSGIGHAADLYVDGANGSDSNTGSSAAEAFKTPLKAWRGARPGDVIHLLPTATYGPLYLQNNAGTSTAWITIQGDGVAPGLTKIVGDGVWNGIKLDTGINYIKIENLDIRAPGNLAAIFVINSHHVTVANNVLHDSGAAGFSAFGSDYITVDHNTVYHNSWGNTATMFGSGISIGESVDVDSNTGVKEIIRNNSVYNNTNQNPASCSGPCDTDGSGIIIDDNRRTQHDNITYKGAILIENNVVYNNGGRGIHLYSSDNITVRNNTLYKNNQDPGEKAWGAGEIMVSRSGGVSVYNNILYSDAGNAKGTGPHVAFSAVNGSGEPIVADDNLMYAANNDQSLANYTNNNSNAVTIGSHNRWGDPLFRAPSVDPAVANFQVQSGSPAIGFDSPAGTFSATDILGTPRSVPITAGAWQTTYAEIPVTAPFSSSSTSTGPAPATHTGSTGTTHPTGPTIPVTGSPASGCTAHYQTSGPVDPTLPILLLGAPLFTQRRRWQAVARKTGRNWKRWIVTATAGILPVPDTYR